MKLNFQKHLVAGACLLVSSGVWSTTAVIDFEGLPLFGSLTGVYSGQGVDFDTSCFAYNSGDPNYPAFSGTGTAVCNPLPTTITFSAPVSNVGAYFNNYVSNLTFSAFDTGGALLGSTTIGTTIQPTPGGMQFYQLAFAGIGSVQISIAPGGNPSGAFFYNFDDLTFTTASVPEPGSLALMGLAFTALVASRRAKRI
jgi:hypothetical protein